MVKLPQAPSLLLSMLVFFCASTPAIAQFNPNKPLKPELTPTPLNANATPRAGGCSPGIPGCPHTFRCANGLPGCPDQSPDDIRGIVRSMDWTWSQPDAIPYVLSPRRTLLLTPQPLLRWHPVAEADHYQVTVLDEVTGAVVWETSEPIAATEVTYPGPALEAGREYYLEVRAYRAGSDIAIATSQDDPHAATFAVLETSQQQELQSAAQAITESTANPVQRQRLLADLYLRHGLFVEGMILLEAALQGEPNAPLALRLGTLYFYELRLPREAQLYYQQALARAGDDLETQAIALTELGYSQKALLDYDGAIASWQQAVALYQNLGNATEVESLQRAIRDAQELQRLQE